MISVFGIRGLTVESGTGPRAAVVAFDEAAEDLKELLEVDGLIEHAEGVELERLGEESIVDSAIESSASDDDGGWSGVEAVDDPQEFEAVRDEGIA